MSREVIAKESEICIKCKKVIAPGNKMTISPGLGVHMPICENCSIKPEQLKNRKNKYFKGFKEVLKKTQTAQ